MQTRDSTLYRASSRIPLHNKTIMQLPTNKIHGRLTWFWATAGPVL